jgi:Tol biopolymer transport system component
MELVEGQSFSELIPRDGYSTNKLLIYAIDIADAVASAHKKGITHRDLKPDNLMLDNEGRVKVMDFGLAKLEEGSIAASGSTEMPTESVTQEGKVLGTVAYMSPEQAEGKPVDARSDVFSLGVVLYEMATGLRPFQGDTSISTITAILRDNPDSVTDINPRLPRHLGRVIRRCLTKDPDRRYQSALDLRNELEELNREIKSGELDSDTTAAVADLPPQQKSRVVPLLGAAVGALILLVGYLGFRQVGEEEAPGSSESSQSAGPTMQIQQLTNTGKSTRAAISPDGRYVMHVVAEAGQQSLWLRQVSTESNVQVLPPAEVRFDDLAFSVDGERLYFSRRQVGRAGSDLFYMPILGGSEMKVVENVSGFSLSKDGSQLATVLHDPSQPQVSQLAIIDSEGGESEVLVTKVAPEDLFGPGVAWSPDGSQLMVFAGTLVGGFTIWFEVVDLESRESNRLDYEGLFPQEMIWLPDGSGLLLPASSNILTDGQIWMLSYPELVPERLTRDLSDYQTLSISADAGSLVSVVEDQEAKLWRVDLDQGGSDQFLGNFTGTLNGIGGIASTEDGRIVFNVGAANGATHVWSANPDGTELQQLTRGDEAAFDTFICGQHVYFVLAQELKSINVWRVGLDGSGLTKMTNGTIDITPSCGGDPQSFFFTSFTAGTAAIWKGSVEGGEATMFSSGDTVGEREPVVSPDGRLLALEARNPQTNRWTPRIIDLATGDLVLDIPEISYSDNRWRPDGSGLTLVRSENGVENVWIFPLDGGDPEQLTFFTDSQEIFSYTWLPDRNSLILSRGTRSRDVVLLTDFR